MYKKNRKYEHELLRVEANCRAQGSKVLIKNNIKTL